MAKSLRSKWKRKMRANKREKYAPRELARLKKTLEKKDSFADVEMMDSSLVTVTDAKKIKEDAAKKQDSMDVDGPKFNRKTMTDEHGQYPIWMGKKARKQIQKKKKAKGKKGSKGAW